MPTLKLAPAFTGLLEPYRHKVFYGGRGGTKSWQFADCLLVLAACGHERVLCLREVQNSLKDSVKRLLEDRIKALGLSAVTVITDAEIRFPATNSVFIFSGVRSNPESIKSYEGITRCWIEEAETISEKSLDLIIPTIRSEYVNTEGKLVQSELWFSFNPDRESSPVYKRFVLSDIPPPNSLIRKVGWRDNPWFPAVLRDEMEHCKATDYDKYLHVWEGEPIRIAKGAYYARLLQDAVNDGRIGSVPYEPGVLVNTAWDLGVSDSTCIWFYQAVPMSSGVQYRVIDYYESHGVGLQHYISVLHAKGYEYGRHIAPHDIRHRELTSGKSRLDTARTMGLRFDICPNIGVMDGIDVARGIIKKAYFDDTNCREGLNALWAYQREYDDKIETFKDKPRHDWASHGADAFRYLAVGHRDSGLGSNRTAVRQTTTNCGLWR